MGCPSWTRTTAVIWLKAAGIRVPWQHQAHPPGWHPPLAPGQALHLACARGTGMGLCARGRPRADLLGDLGLLLVVKEPQTHRQGLSPRQAPVFFSEQKSPLRLFCQQFCQGHLVPASRRLRMGHPGRQSPLGAGGSPGLLHPSPGTWGGVDGGGDTEGGDTGALSKACRLAPQAQRSCRTQRAVRPAIYTRCAREEPFCINEAILKVLARYNWFKQGQ